VRSSGTLNPPPPNAAAAGQAASSERRRRHATLPLLGCKHRTSAAVSQTPARGKFPASTKQNRTPPMQCPRQNESDYEAGSATITTRTDQAGLLTMKRAPPAASSRSRRFDRQTN